MPSREEQFDFFTNTFDDEGEEEEKRTSAVKAGIKLEAQRRASMPGVSEAQTDTDAANKSRVSNDLMGFYIYILVQRQHFLSIQNNCYTGMKLNSP